MHYERIVVIGTSGSGKSTLAKELGQRLRFRYVELDALHWAPNWVEVPDEEMRVRLAEALEMGAWIVDGNYIRMRDLVWRRAQLIIWLDYPFLLVFSRALRRTFRRILNGEELWHGNRENWRMTFLSKDSILLWVITSHFKRSKQYPMILQQPEYQHLRLVRLRTPLETTRWLETIKPLQHEEA